MQMAYQELYSLSNIKYCFCADGILGVIQFVTSLDIDTVLYLQHQQDPQEFWKEMIRVQDQISLSGLEVT